ncbi:MAG: putative Phosphoenolpyruvate carboxylase kinase 1 [Streblomastix strix]|uniref:Putative Phosphoenolpyruvate carboxylase kinase 1 n=1 Tax=Streblomastix strix TaxID=222440 RepID=A0A5J4UZE5_9EUKA|nr:MAG: putative Phosphoenolpyruvate carboxylase kinase 1 [Streblomastix strix]
MEETRLLESQGFQIFKTIGHGSFGQVFLVYHPELNVVAAKVMKNENFLETEWDAAGIFQSDPPQIRPFIINNILAKKFDTMTVILIELANLGNLQSLLDTNIIIPLPIVRAIMKQLLEGLKFIHSKKIIHRDIKPANILLHNPPGSGRVICKIADFGEMKVKSLADHSTYMGVAGTLVYMPPEIFLGNENEQKKADEKIDVWSLGILVYQTVTHTFPFITPTNQAIYQFMEKYQQTGILNRPYSIKDNYLWDLLYRMLAFDYHNRISASDALQHPFFTNEQALREITLEQRQLAQIAQSSVEDSWTNQSRS